MTFVQKLLSISSPATISNAIACDSDGFDSHGHLGRELLAMLRLKNGFYSFESALQVFPAAGFTKEETLNHWNSHALWKFEYEGLADGKLCFAQDTFGNQFCIFKDTIWLFDAETGDLEFRSNSLEGWAERVLSDYRLETGFPLLHDWQKAHGKIAKGTRLMPKIPFVLGGEYKLENLYSLNAISAMKSRGNLAKQIKCLPDGTKVKFTIID